ncbi:hypothetical protein DL95DRAFT_379846 [Leptodontidium sp. 2 PMI_412]|nr:hypothetical protein DL95DRAFT_379846 [Leptodontidium sp. 2 PMI_412]
MHPCYLCWDGTLIAWSALRSKFGLQICPPTSISYNFHFLLILSGLKTLFFLMF